MYSDIQDHSIHRTTHIILYSTGTGKRRFMRGQFHARFKITHIHKIIATPKRNKETDTNNDIFNCKYF